MKEIARNAKIDIFQPSYRHPLKDVIEYLQDVLDDNKKDCSNIWVELDSDYGYTDCPAIVICGDRLETNEEENKRMNSLREKDEREYQEYLKLKDKFEK